MTSLKKIIKINSHNAFFKALAGFGRALNRFYENRNHDIESNGELTILKKLAPFDPSIIFDGGANIGNYSLLINQIVPHCRIYAFEPVESTYEKLVDNTKNCKLVCPIKKGLFKENSQIEINLFPSDEHSSIFKIEGLKYNIVNKEKIELIKGDDFIQNNKIASIDLLKLDIEGAEYDALLGFEESFRMGIIKMVQFEYGYINITTKKLLIDYYNFFEKNDYIVGKIFPKNVEFRKYDYIYEDFLGPNFVAVKKSEIELIDILSRI